MNPHPKRVVKSIDFVSDLQTASYCVISAVVAKTDPSRPKTKSIPLNQPKREFKGKIGIVVNSAETGKPIKDATIQTSVDTKGVYIVAKTVATDDKGKAEFRYWKEETSYVALQVSAPGYLPAYKSLRREIPLNASFAPRKGRRVGSTVVDDAGNPMAGMSVVM